MSVESEPLGRPDRPDRPVSPAFRYWTGYVLFGLIVPLASVGMLFAHHGRMPFWHDLWLDSPGIWLRTAACCEIVPIVAGAFAMHALRHHPVVLRGIAPLAALVSLWWLWPVLLAGPLLSGFLDAVLVQLVLVSRIAVALMYATQLLYAAARERRSWTAAARPGLFAGPRPTTLPTGWDWCGSQWVRYLFGYLALGVVVPGWIFAATTAVAGGDTMVALLFYAQFCGAAPTLLVVWIAALLSRFRVVWILAPALALLVDWPVWLLLGRYLGTGRAVGLLGMSAIMLCQTTVAVLFTVQLVRARRRGGPGLQSIV